MAPPIIIIHRGDSPYLAYTIAQAKDSNPESRVILLGDRSNAFYLGVEHYAYTDYFADAEDFSKWYRHEHFPNYQYPWILFCHQKYFVLRDFCKRHQLKSILLIDTDVLIYEDIRSYFNYYSESFMTLSSSGSEICAQASFAIINNSVILDKLCHLYRKMYTKPIESLREEYGTKEFTEMVGLGVLMRKDPQEIINTYHKNANAFIFNHSMVADNRFDFSGKLLKLDWENNIPYLKEISSQSLIKTPFLHFHGKGKYVMGKHLKLKRKIIILQMCFNRALSASLKYPRRFVNKVMRRDIFPGI